MRADDPDTFDAIALRMESWKNIMLNLRGESLGIDNIGFSSRLTARALAGPLGITKPSGRKTCSGYAI